VPEVWGSSLSRCLNAIKQAITDPELWYSTCKASVTKVGLQLSQKLIPGRTDKLTKKRCGNSLALVLFAAVVYDRLRERLITSNERLGRSTSTMQQTTLCVPSTIIHTHTQMVAAR